MFRDGDGVLNFREFLLATHESVSIDKLVKSSNSSYTPTPKTTTIAEYM